MVLEKIRVGDILVEKNLISNEQLQTALSIQKETNYSKKLGEIFIEEGYISEKEMAMVLASQLNYEFIDLFAIDIDFELLKTYPSAIFHDGEAIIFKEDTEFVYVALADPLNYDVVELIERSIVIKPLKIYVATKNQIKQIIDRFNIIQTTKSLVDAVKSDINSNSSKQNGEQSSILKLIEQIIKSSIHNKASDIHIEPNEYNVSVRLRVDGILREIFVLDIEVYNALASRIKILGNLDISERRKSQDGRFALSVDGAKYDFRLSTAPTFFGESIVIRILDQQKVLLKLDDLGLSKTNLKKLDKLLKAPYGIVLVTGPTGSGKTTSLYAALNEIKDIENKVLTIEDPIEYHLPLIQQIQINEKIEYSFSSALKSILRQDPDIIMIGEIRDDKTLHSAVQASLTGHLVFSTLHTNDAPSAITRMAQMGLDPYLIADSLIGVVAQRLVRKICKYCKKEHNPHFDLIEQVKEYLPHEYKFYKGAGCSQCNNTGYSGREMVCEILEINDEISNLIAKNKNKFDIAQNAMKNGYRPMIYDGIEKALESKTSLEEVLRVVKV